jgi:hypothetical protein
MLHETNGHDVTIIKLLIWLLAVVKPIQKKSLDSLKCPGLKA